MNQKQILVELFSRNGWKMTLRQLLSDPTGVGYKCTSRFSDLRKEGYFIKCEEKDNPSDNTYYMTPPLQNGQTRFI